MSFVGPLDKVFYLPYQQFSLADFRESDIWATEKNEKDKAE